MQNITESPSNYPHLDRMTVKEILTGMNQEDVSVPLAVEKAIPQIEQLVEHVFERMQSGGRVFYIGAGTSGRLGVLDASEIPPTYGVHDVFIGLIAGGDTALRRPVESAEDNETQAWIDMEKFAIDANDTVIGIAASGTTPYVIGGIKKAREMGLLTGSISCNPGSPLAEAAEIPIEIFTGPEFVTGSTRMKAGTAQKLVLNMISTSLMIKMGRVKGSKMVNMQLTNKKLVDRGSRMIRDELQIPIEEAQKLLLKHGSVKKALGERFR